MDDAVTKAHPGTTRLLSIPTASSFGTTSVAQPDEYHIEYSTHVSSSGPRRPEFLKTDEVITLFSRCEFPSDAHFVPERMEIRRGDGKDSKKEDRRIVILSKDGLRYRVFRFTESGVKASGTRDEDVQMTQ